MTIANYDSMSLDELRVYVLSHRDDIAAFQVYVDRSKSAGRMITIDPSNPGWEREVDNRLRQSDGL
ncbi:MAG: hypothetical protein AAF728_12015 [Cyanobacteria bacterium P01_D01_bin.128]